MSIFEIVMHILVFILTAIFFKGVVIWIYSKLPTSNYIKVVVKDKNGVKNYKKFRIDDEKFINELLEIRKKQLPQENYREE